MPNLNPTDKSLPHSQRVIILQRALNAYRKTGTRRAASRWLCGSGEPDCSRHVVSAAIAWAHENMAAYKAPRIVQFVEALPKSGSGKILWRKLQEEEGDAR